MKNVIIELKVSSIEEAFLKMAELDKLQRITIDFSYKPILVRRSKRKSVINEGDTYVVRGSADDNILNTLSNLPFIKKIWNDSKIYHFCNCNSSKKGTLDDVAECLGAKILWEKGFKGEGIVVGIVDGGVDKSIIKM